jgi:hypothetical protein
LLSTLLPENCPDWLDRQLEGIPEPIDVWRKILTLQEYDESELIAREINTRKFRLGAPPLSVIKAQVESEVRSKSTVCIICHQCAHHAVGYLVE